MLAQESMLVQEAMLAQKAMLAEAIAAICSPRVANAQLSDLLLSSDTNMYPAYSPTPPSYCPELPELLPLWLGEGWDPQTFGLEQGAAGMAPFSAGMCFSTWLSGEHS